MITGNFKKLCPHYLDSFSNKSLNKFSSRNSTYIHVHLFEGKNFYSAIFAMSTIIIMIIFIYLMIIFEVFIFFYKNVLLRHGLKISTNCSKCRTIQILIFLTFYLSKVVDSSKRKIVHPSTECLKLMFRTENLPTLNEKINLVLFQLNAVCRQRFNVEKSLF